MQGGRIARRLVAGALLALTLVLPAVAPAATPRPAVAIPLGTSVWWGCMKPSSILALSCPVSFDPRYRQALDAAPFEVLVPENEMKMPFLQPSRGRYDFSIADQMVAYARDTGRTVRGHTLVFAKDLPVWMTSPLVALNWKRDTLLGVLRDHVFTVMRHFKTQFPGVIREWDVVNEAFRADGRLDDNLLTKVIGPDWIEQVFRFAHEADPDALLFYNEFDADGPNPKQQAVLNMVSDFKRRGVPIDGIGMQMHLGMTPYTPSSAERRQVMDAYEALGLRVEVTELDTRYGDDSLRSVAQDCASVRACVGLTIWGLSDSVSWRGPQSRATLYDAEFQPKPTLAQVRADLAAAPPRIGAVRRRTSRHARHRTARERSAPPRARARTHRRTASARRR